MSEDDILKCLICFVLGFLVSRMMRGNGMSVGGVEKDTRVHFCNNDKECLDGGKYSKCIDITIDGIDPKDHGYNGYCQFSY